MKLIILLFLQCEYIIRMKTGDGVNKNIQRTLPSSQIIKVLNHSSGIVPESKYYISNTNLSGSPV